MSAARVFGQQAISIGYATPSPVGDVVDAPRPARVTVAPPAPRSIRAVMDAPLVAPASALLGDALDAAFDAGADVVLVRQRGEVVGLLLVWDVCQHERATPVAQVCEPIPAVVSDAASLGDVLPKLGESELSCVLVRSRDDFTGVVTRRSLRRAGVKAPVLDEPAVPYEELGVGG
jgi:hypothetical protein